MKVRVFQLARELKISSDALVNMIQSLEGDQGSDVKSHMSAVDEDTAAAVRKRMVQERSAARRDLRKRSGGVSKTTVSAPTVTQPKPAPASRPKPEPVREERPVEAQPSRPAERPESEVRGAPTPSAPPRREPPRPSPTGPSRDGGDTGPPPRRPSPPSAPPRRSTGGRVPPQARVRQDSVRVSAGTDTRPKRKRKKGREVDKEAVRSSVRRTMHEIQVGRGKGRRRRRMGGADEAGPVETKKRNVHEYATVAELASLLEVKPTEVIATCLQLGIMANINKQLDKDEIETILDEFGFEAEFVQEYGAEVISQDEDEVEGVFENRPRAPIVTVMGHVDHGKTTLLDHIRKSRVTESESGGITQHIGAYNVTVDDRNICFLDTPGHEAFSAMRARGAKVTDIVILVVAADDQVRPQTMEAINHAKAAHVPIIVAINKIDSPHANPDNVRKGLADAGVLVEEWGGQVVSVEISAKQGTNMDKLLEMILLVTELQDLKAEPDRRARGVVIEAKRDQGRGIVATILVQNGTLRVGDPFVCGNERGKVRAMIDEIGTRVDEAGPSTPVEVLGWSGVPQAGDNLAVMQTDQKAREISAHRTQIARLHQHRLSRQSTSLASIQERIKAGDLNELNVVIKADVGGSVEVLRDKLESLSTPEVSVRVIHTGVGLINESDVLLALASRAIIIGFHTRPDAKAHQLALNEHIDIRLYRVIYDIEKDVKDAMAGLLAPEEVEKSSGTAEVRQVFDVSKVGTIAGCMVVSGTIHRNDRARVYRGTDEIYKGSISSLKRVKEDVREVQSGFECGIGLEGFEDLSEGDVIEAFTIEQVARTID